MDPRPSTPQEEHEVAEHELSESLVRLRRVEGGAVRALRESLLRHGQLVALMVYRPEKEPGRLEVVDGFQRLHAARALEWRQVRVRILQCTDAEAKAAITILNQGQSISTLEEAWVVRALYREDRLTQPQIGQLLERDKSWVCRRLLLAEGLEEGVQADVRLGLLSARTAATLARLPRANQAQACERVQRHGLTVPQTERLGMRLLRPPPEEREVALDVELSGLPEREGKPERRGPPATLTPAQQLSADVAQLTKVSGRLQARLLATPLTTLKETAARLLREGFTGLIPVLRALQQTLERVTETPHETMDHTNRT